MRRVPVALPLHQTSTSNSIAPPAGWFSQHPCIPILFFALLTAHKELPYGRLLASSGGTSRRLALMTNIRGQMLDSLTRRLLRNLREAPRVLSTLRPRNVKPFKHCFKPHLFDKTGQMPQKHHYRKHTSHHCETQHFYTFFSRPIITIPLFILRHLS